MAICRYFEEIQPSPALLGRAPKEKALVESRQRKMEFDGMIGDFKVFRNQNERFANYGIPGGGTDPIAAIHALINCGNQTLWRFFHWLEVYLA